MSGRGAVFVDRDGVINELVPDPVSGRPESPLRPADVTLVPGAAAALRRLAEAGWPLIGVSNQPGAAKGVVGVQEIQAVQTRVLELLAAEDVRLDAFELCLHHPDGVVPELTGRCDCRKPAPGMLLAAARRLHLDLTASWMVGDTDADVAAGRAAGSHTVLIEHPDSGHKRSSRTEPDRKVRNLAAAASVIVGAEVLS